MREQLIQILQERAGLDISAAERAADVVIDFIREKGPEMLRSGEFGGGGGIGGIFGR